MRERRAYEKEIEKLMHRCVARLVRFLHFIGGDGLVGGVGNTAGGVGAGLGGLVGVEYGTAILAATIREKPASISLLRHV